MKSLSFVSIIFIALAFKTMPSVAFRMCPDIEEARPYDDTFFPMITYYTSNELQEAKMTCIRWQHSEITELISNRGSLGSKEYNYAICKNGIWYTMDKNRELTPFHRVYCQIHKEDSWKNWLFSW